MEYTSVSSVQRTSRAKVLGIIALAVVGTLVASYAVFSATPAQNRLAATNINIDPDTVNGYNSWKKNHGKNFDPQEEGKRFAIWTQANQIIKDHNAAGNSYQLGHNQFSHLTQEEFAAVSLGFYLSTNTGGSTSGSSSSSTTRSLATLPTSVNWVTKGGVTPVKNQGSCGSCYTFSSTGALEGLAFIKTGSLPSLSEQQLVDCTNGGKYLNNGCNGGWMGSAFQYVIDNKGIASETAYAYTGALGTCKTTVAKTFTSVTSYSYVTQNSSTAMLTAIAASPVSVTVQASTSYFQLYKSGIFNDTRCGTTIDHAVLAVGYNQTAGNYLIKNSWGTTWGESGYIRLAIHPKADAPGVCGSQIWGVVPH